jgi:hypothetical protein
MSSVHVRFLSAEGEALLGEVDLPAEQLPESFEARTTLQLGEQTWEVVRAEPLTRAEYARTGALTVVLHPLQVDQVPVEKLLYSLPTICDTLPAIAPASSKLGKRVLEMHEDDWRQVELVSSALRATVLAELEGVRRALGTRAQVGFRELHLRREPAAPLAGHRLGKGDLVQGAGFDGVAFAGAAGLVAGGFAVDAGDYVLYGIDDGGITTLGVHGARPDAAVALAELCARHKLLLVDWCGARVIG